MKRGLFLLSAIVFLAGSATGYPQAREGNSALEALASLGPDFQSYVTKMTADSADPNPATWYLFALKGSTTGAVYSFEISGGEITSQRPSLNLGQLFSRPTPIATDKITVDSPQAFEIAREFGARKGKKLGTVSFGLVQEGAGATPVWQTWCYDLGGKYFGYLEISASTGEILSTED